MYIVYAVYIDLTALPIYHWEMNSIVGKLAEYEKTARGNSDINEAVFEKPGMSELKAAQTGCVCSS